jgi:periplasmic divalent cation tolerance protein
MVVLSTLPDGEKAAEVARVLVDERLIACANVLPPVRSIYRWQGKVNDEHEVLVVLKTSAQTLGRMQQRLRELHPYDVPEMLALRVESGWPPYLEWLARETGPEGDDARVK